MRRHLPLLVAALAAAALPVSALRAADRPPGAVGLAGDDCTAPSYVVRSLSGAPLPRDLGRPMLRFANLSDSHILDDEAPPAMTGSVIDPVLDPAMGNGSAQRLQEEYTDEVLDAMVERLNQCAEVDGGIALMIATGDLTDNMTLNELRRYIDNLDGVAAGPTAYEHYCGYDTAGLDGRPDPKAQVPCDDRAALAGVTGRTVADAQTAPPDPDDASYLFSPTRTARQTAETEASALAAGSLLAAPGLPPSLRCDAGQAGCANDRLGMPHYAVFGNHDGAVRGTVVYQDAFQPAANVLGRYFTGNQREFINEFFFTNGEPRGHGFNHAGPRLSDGNPRNDGWYAFEAGGVRMIVLNTIIDGVTEGSSLRDPSALEKGGVDADQLKWLDAELAEADRKGRPALVFSHHPTRSFHDADQGVALDKVLSAHRSLVAHIAGHTHENRVRPCTADACKARPFWQVETASLIDYPQEGRIVEVYRLRGGGYALRLTMVEPYRPERSVDARRSWELSKAEAECTTKAMLENAGPPSSGGEAAVRELFCRADRTLAEGAPEERDVILLP